MGNGENSAGTVSVAVIDDHDVVHEGVRAWCAQADFPVRFVGNYHCPVSFARDHPLGSRQVEVVVFDLELRGQHLDFSALRRFCDSGHRVIVYSHITADEIILTCLDYGAVTYLTKSEGRQHLLDAIKAARTDSPYVGPRMAAAMVNGRRNGRPNLAPREKEVLIAWFRTETKEIVARDLYITPSTVRTHLQRIRAKYAAVGRPAPTKAALVARAIQDGIIRAHEL